MFFTHKHTELHAFSFSIMCSQARMYELIILTGGKNNNKIKIAESRQSAPTLWAANILLSFPKVADRIDCLYGEGRGGEGREGVCEKVGSRVKRASRYY